MSQTSTTDYQEPRQIGLWLWFLTLSFWPRLFLLGFWIFGSQLGDAFKHGWVVPTIGFFVAPSTTCAYALTWGTSSDGVHGVEWVVVAVGLLLDLWMWGSWQRIRSDS